MNKIISIALSVLRSNKFFLVIVGLLVIQASWIALSARYPMAFDENFHFGIIKLYSHQWSPFFTTPPADSAQFGDLVRNPSYLYQYLMSFPYRFATLFIHQETIQIIIMRFLNISLFTAGLFAFRALLLRLRVSAAITHISLLMLILIPVVPFLAGQINYDNLVFLLVPLVMLLALACRQAIVDKAKIPPVSTILLVILGMLGGLVKYAFLPIFVAILLYLAVIIVRNRHLDLVTKTVKAFWQLSTWLKIGLVIGVIISSGLFIERYGVNIVLYHSLQPDCAKIESLDQCMQYGPWARNYIIAANNEVVGDVLASPDKVFFLPVWTYGMMHRLYFAINYDYFNYEELPIPITSAFIIGGIGLILYAVFCWTLFKRNRLLLLPATVIIIYAASLLYVNFTDYLHFKTMLAINGRYLILILPLLFVLLASAYRIFFERITPRHARAYILSLTVAALLLASQGGGLLTFIVRSDETWYWPDNATVTNINLGVKNVITPLIFGADERKESSI